MVSIEDLIEDLVATMGTKIVTVRTEVGSQQFDIKGRAIGYGVGHAELLKAKIAHAVAAGGSLVVRQFQKETTTKLMPNGKVMDVPRKRVAGFVLGHGRIEPISASAMRSAHTTCAETGKELPPEDGVSFVHPSGLAR
jgi:DUF917 family protein